ncbi:reverse transcriptase domain-containing protein [Tanacetum coccineum]
MDAVLRRYFPNMSIPNTQTTGLKPAQTNRGWGLPYNEFEEFFLELQELWKGVWTKDAATNTLFQMKAAVLWTINDFPARSSLSGWSGQGYYACPTCNEDTPSMAVKSKIVYVGHRRFLRTKHPLRSKFKEFYVSVLSFGIKRKLGVLAFLSLKNNLDVMHIEKNALEALLNTLLQNDKSKDTIKARQDLETLRVRKELWMMSRRGRNDDGLPEEEPDKFQVFRSVCKPTGRMKETRLTTDVMQEVVWFVLNNSPEVDADILAYREESPDNVETSFPVCGVSTPGLDGEMYYGQLEEILELTYIGHRKVFLFRSTQVFYLEDLARQPRGWKVVEHAYHRDVAESDHDVIHGSSSSHVTLLCLMMIDSEPCTKVEEVLSSDDSAMTIMACVVLASHGGDAGGSPHRTAQTGPYGPPFDAASLSGKCVLKDAFLEGKKQQLCSLALITPILLDRRPMLEMIKACFIQVHGNDPEILVVCRVLSGQRQNMSGNGPGSYRGWWLKLLLHPHFLCNPHMNDLPSYDQLTQDLARENNNECSSREEEEEEEEEANVVIEKIIDYVVDPQVLLILGRPFLRTAHALIDVYGEELTIQEFAQEVLGFSNISKSGNPTPTLEPILSTSPTSLTPFEGGDFILEEIEACLTSESIPPGIDDADFDPKEDLLTLERLLNSDPTSTLPPEEQKFEELKTVEPSSDELPELELKDLPPHLEYAFLEGTDKLPVIIAKDLKDEDKTALLKVLRSHKRAIAWKMSDIKGIDPKFCTHKILMEDNVKPTVQHQRRVNPKIHEVIKKEVIKLLEAGLIYPISDSPWVSPVHCVPKKGGITVIENDDNELIPTRLITGWRVCIDYQKLNDATRKEYFPLPFMDQMLERLAGNEYYCFLDGFSGYFQIPIDPKDQEKTTFTCPYGTFAYRRMPFGLCNAPGTFQRCMMAIFHDMIEETMEVFMDDFSVFRDSFSSCLSYLDKMLKRCEDTNLVLN